MGVHINNQIWDKNLTNLNELITVIQEGIYTYNIIGKWSTLCLEDGPKI